METVDFKFGLGDLLEDKVTGFQGIVMVRAEYSTGCIHFGLCPQQVEKNKIPDWEWLDQSRLKLIEQGEVTFNVPEGTTSGPFPKGPQL